MFPTRAPRSRSAKTKRSPITRRLSRRFGVEVMEGRLMLAAAGLDVTAVELQPVSMVATLNLFDTRTAYYSAVGASTTLEGGYVPVLIHFDSSIGANMAGGSGVVLTRDVQGLNTAWTQ